MATIDLYIDGDERRRKRRRGKWLLPLFVGVIAAYTAGRQKPAAIAPVALTVGLQKPAIAVQAPPGDIAPAPAPVPPAPPARLAVGPLRLDFGDGPLTRGVPAQMAVIRNDGGQPLPRVTVAAARPFLVTSGCVRDLAPGGECMVAVVFAPQQPGQFAGSLKIAAGTERAQIPLRGSVPRPRQVVPPAPAPAPPPVVVQAPPPPPVPVAPALPPARVLCFQPALLRFTSTGKQTISLTNPEPVPLRVVAVLPIGRQGQTLSGYEIDAGRCIRVLKPGQQCKFTVRANEIALRTSESMQMKVYYDDPATGTRRPALFSPVCGR
jgi:hypothetical protein